MNGLVLSGSAFGLEAAGGLISWLAVRGRGTRLDGCCIPTVSGAIIYDLANGGSKPWGETPPYRALAVQAVEQASPEFALGNAGAGYGAVAGRNQGRSRHRVRGGSDYGRNGGCSGGRQSGGLGHHAGKPHHVGLASRAGG